VTKSIEIAQKRVEAHNFEIRKQLLEYDNVMNKQREVIYAQRRQTLEGASLKEEIQAIIEKLCEELIAAFSAGKPYPEEWDLAALAGALKSHFNVLIDEQSLRARSADEARIAVLDAVQNAYAQKELAVGDMMMREMERMVFLQIIDSKWKDHLYAMDGLREGIGLRAYGQRDPLVEYKREAFTMFAELIASIEEEAVSLIFKLQPPRQEQVRRVFRAAAQELVHPEFVRPAAPTAEKPTQPSAAEPPASAAANASATPRVGRNDPCPCGSGKKYKKCCGA
jgi:preprotein translocase subunit SecA